MAKLTAWLMTLVGVLWVADVMDWTASTVSSNDWMGWLVALSFLVIGISKLMRNYSSRRK